MSILELDKELFFLINTGISNPMLDLICPLFRNKFFWIWLYLLVIVLLFRKHRYRAFYLILLVILIIIATDQLSSSLIKPIFKRLRPCNDPEMGYMVRLLIEHCGRGFSFVSSHAANHFALAVFCIFFLSHRYKKILWLSWAILISFSQIYVGVHFPLDVLVGAILGIIISLMFIKIFTIKYTDFIKNN